ncbi:MAG: transposase [Verrucomicrobia bacterium]|jgi:hypothetical protein|nr:transposase [Verrucomicrobiota bacterium]MBT4903513.1 transposase [Verrucomicrobiota bacterium]MBT7911342.1 transposase [Verrucomicrobiota bacterium]
MHRVGSQITGFVWIDFQVIQFLSGRGVVSMRDWSSFNSPLAEVRVLGNEHRSYYNEKRPHSSLGGKSPRVYAAHCSVPVGATPLPTPNNGSENPEPNLS